MAPLINTLSPTYAGLTTCWMTSLTILLLIAITTIINHDHVVQGVPLPNCSNSTGSEYIIVNLSECQNVDYNPNGPLVPCTLIPNEFKICDFDMKGYSNGIKTCSYDDMVNQNGVYTQNTRYGYANCTVLSTIECIGPRTWYQKFPCKTIQNNFQYTTALVLAVFVGIFGADRFYLQHIVLGVIKLLTLGGIGVWWIVDIGLLIGGVTVPADGSSWQQYY
ncbi:hypothetical protein C9374_014125 [Naegleria lovaniensis]|uniref:TM2 domain-containing protein n=1 Tax=Naegleria lovaniensis TaxID=51637 RepID=A0AA88GYT9_NAELO|nr:uncharacterized protein C9374_014125 [Naegleria lovaniensis]KAG2389565.1 hypothetical protein C9374_014125 [Naegleria lovaniensis]